MEELYSNFSRLVYKKNKKRLRRGICSDVSDFSFFEQKGLPPLLEPLGLLKGRLPTGESLMPILKWETFWRTNAASCLSVLGQVTLTCFSCAKNGGAFRVF